MRRSLSISLVTAALLLSACGGERDESASADAPPSAVNSEPPTWRQGQYEPASTYKDQCEFIRRTNDINGNPYPDQDALLAHELFWLRSWSNETYLWYDEITDRNPNDFDDKLVYFDELKTTAQTPSGNPKDRFHFTYDTDEWERIRASGASASYGAEFAFVRSAPPRDIRIAFNQSNSPSANAGLVRGTKILTINGEDVRNGSDTAALNAGLFPDNANETHTFGVEFPDGTRQDVTLTSAIVEEIPVNISQTVEINGRTLGYVHFTTFSPRTAEVGLFDAFDDLQAAGIDDLILDLRYNGGGLLDIASQLGFMVAGSRTTGRTFSTLQFNDKADGVNPITGNIIRPTPFYNEGLGFTVESSRSSPTVNKGRVFILTTSRTCSASEAVINALRGIDVEVILIGGQTCGKPYGFYATDNCGTTYFTIQFRGVNEKNFGDYSDGFTPNAPIGTMGDSVPGCVVADDFSKDLGDPDEALLKTAIAYAETGSCPAVTTAEKSDLSQFEQIGFQSDPALDLLNDPRLRVRDLVENGRLGR